LVDQLFDRNVQGVTFAEQLEALDRFTPAIGAGARNRHKACDRTPMLGDREPFAPSDPREQGGQMSLGLVGANFP
jgi:hypothetical protein